MCIIQDVQAYPYISSYLNRYRLCFVVYCLQTYTKLVSSADRRLSTEHKHSPKRCISLTAAAAGPRNNLGYVCLFVYLLGHGESETKFRQLTVWVLWKSAVWSGASHLPATASAIKTNKAMAGGYGVGWREARPGDTAGHRAGMWGRWHSDQLIHGEKYHCYCHCQKIREPGIKQFTATTLDLLWSPRRHWSQA